MEIPIYLFTGFLESGKTKFIQETLEDPRFKTGEKTLIIVCEEGEEEYSTEKFAEKNVVFEYVDDASILTPQKFAAWEMKYAPKRVIIEYNGMWQVAGLMQALPENWLVYQEITFADSRNFEFYNANMRSLVVDKLSGCELVVFNRWNPDISQENLHKIVRGVSRRTDIIYEDKNGNVMYDETEDPLPFDVDAPVIEIADRDYAIWFRDFAENTKNYIGKKVKFKGIVGVDGLPEDSFVIGRHVMTCCVEDIEYKGLACVSNGAHPFKSKDWIILTAEIGMGKHKAYRGKEGPLLKMISFEKAEKPEQDVATFY